MATIKTNLTADKKIISIDEALEASNLNFIAEEHELMTGTGIFTPDHKAIIRPDTGTVLGVVGKKYVPTQNSLSFSFMDAIVQKNGFHYAEAISKDDGAVSVITARSDRADAVKVGDEVRREIKLINGFNGKVGLAVEFSMLRLVCTNGMVRSERESIMRFKHTIRVQDRMETALKVFDESVEFHEEFIRMSKILAQKAVDKTMVEKFLKEIYGESKQSEKKREKIEEIANNGKGNDGSTLWSFYNGVTEFVDHHYGTEETRDSFANFGAGHKLKEKAWDTAIALATA